MWNRSGTDCRVAWVQLNVIYRIISKLNILIYICTYIKIDICLNYQLITLTTQQAVRSVIGAGRDLPLTIIFHCRRLRVMKIASLMIHSYWRNHHHLNLRLLYFRLITLFFLLNLYQPFTMPLNYRFFRLWLANHWIFILPITLLYSCFIQTTLKRSGRVCLSFL